MECPYCQTELKHCDTYFRGKPGRYVNGHLPHPLGYYSEPSSNFKVLGEIYKCPNYQGFDDAEDAKRYRDSDNCSNKTEMDDQELTCDSYMFNGNFYTDEQGNLHEGYPC